METETITLQNHITVFDRLMGSGKSTNCINSLKNNKQYRFIYVVPTLSEIERVLEQLPYFVQPTPYTDGRKSTNFLELVQNKENIVTTHSLFKALTIEDPTILNGYNLVMDEVSEVIAPLQVSEDDSKLLFNRDNGVLKLNDDKTITVLNNDYNGKLRPVIDVISAGRVTYQNSSLFIWTYDPAIFRAFDHIIILTYRFKDSIMDYYFQLYKFNDIKINYSEHEGSRTRFMISQIKLFQPKNPKTNRGNYNWNGRGLTYSWYKNPNNRRERLKKVSNKVRNYFRSVGANEKVSVYTTFKDYKDDVEPKGFPDFLSHNAKAINGFSHKTALAYTVNRFMNPYLVRYLESAGIEVNQEEWALSELLQWIFRGCIRRGQRMNLLIMSDRMRKLYLNWVESWRLK